MGDQTVDYLRRIYESGRTTISGNHVFVESGVHVISDIAVEVSSGLHVLMSGQHFHMEMYCVDGQGNAYHVDRLLTDCSGRVIIGSGAVVVDSGLHVQMSGQHVYVESGVGVIIQSGVHVEQVDYNKYLQSGAVVVDSGLHVLMSGQHVYVESGVHIINSGQGVIVQSGVAIRSGIGMVVQSGLHVEQVDYIKSGLVDVNYLHSGAVVVDSGLHTIIDGWYRDSGDWRTVSVMGSGDIRIAHKRCPLSALNETYYSGGETHVSSGFSCEDYRFATLGFNLGVNGTPTDILFEAEHSFDAGVNWYKIMNDFMGDLRYDDTAVGTGLNECVLFRIGGDRIRVRATATGVLNSGTLDFAVSGAELWLRN